MDTLAAALDNVPRSAAAGRRIDSRARFTRTGGGSQFGQAVEVQAMGTRQLSSRLLANGALTSIEGTERSDMTLTIPAVGQSLPVKQYATFSVTRAGAGSRRRSGHHDSGVSLCCPCASRCCRK